MEKIAMTINVKELATQAKEIGMDNIVKALEKQAAKLRKQDESSQKIADLVDSILELVDTDKEKA
jgi:hypothetical protein|tara:strand:- start:786 stop:980 length:195 start_codon:yes stop_codon:yes gene_type:complete